MDLNQQIREFEVNVLDKIHEGIEFFSYTDDIVIPYMLQSYGDYWRHRESLIKVHGEHDVDQFLNNLIFGVGQCIRWSISARGSKRTNLPGGDSGAFKLANELLVWAIDYYRISREFTCYSRGIKSVAFDRGKRSITFTTTARYNVRPVHVFRERYYKAQESSYSSFPFEEIQETFNKWVNEMSFHSPPIHKSLDWSKAKQSRLYILLKDYFTKELLPEVDGKTDLGGYSLDDFRIFYTLFYINFEMIMWIEVALDEKYGVNNSFGSTPLYLSKEQFIDLGVIVTDLRREIVAGIIEDLTFTSESFHSTLYHQPFVRSKNGIYYVLPNLFVNIEPARLISGYLNKGIKKKFYDTIINDIEKYWVSKLKQSVSKTEFQFFINRPVSLRDSQIRPDGILLDHANKTILIWDYKHFTGPTTLVEVLYKMGEIEKSFGQVSGYVLKFKDLTMFEGHDIKGYLIIGIIVTHKPLPVPYPKNTSIPVIDFLSFTNYLENSKKIILADWHRNILNELSIHRFEDEYAEHRQRIVAGEWTVNFSNYVKRFP